MRIPGADRPWRTSGTGIDPEHEDFAGRIHPKSRTFGLVGDLRDVHGHGTHIVGIIAGSGAASDGRFRGVAPGAEILVLKVSSQGAGMSGDVAAAVEYALDIGVDIINYSGGEDGHRAGPPPWKWPQKLSARDRAFEAAVAEGVLCIAAAGNEGPEQGSVVRPGNLRRVVCVGATDENQMIARTSSRGPVYVAGSVPINAVQRAGVEDRAAYHKPDLAAPGGGADLPHYELVLAAMGVSVDGPVAPRSRQSARLLPASVDGQPLAPYCRMAGTSQATAAVSGIAALLVELGGRLGMNWGENRAESLASLLRLSCLRPVWGDECDYGSGLLTWAKAKTLLEECAESEARRLATFQGSPRLRLEP